MNKTNPSATPTEYMTKEEICQLFRISVPTLYRWEKEEGFPKRTRFTGSCVRWNKQDVMAWEKRKALAS